LLILGTRSPLVVEVEETLFRCGIAISGAIAVDGPSRLLRYRDVIALAAFQPTEGQPFIPCAFSSERRRELFGIGVRLGLAPAPALVDPTSVVASSVRVGDGTFINAAAVIGAATMIGDGVLINRAASVGHHCIIGDFVSIGPGATLAGNIRVGEGTIIGAGAVILPDLRIGAGSIVSAGSVVRGHVPDNTLVAGHPARPHPYNPRRSSLNVPGGE